MKKWSFKVTIGINRERITAIRKAVYEDLMTNCENLIEYSFDIATGKSQLGPSCRRASLLIPLSRKLIRGAMKHI
jgi:plasmid rolling circle replication initiator protein Rep